MRTDYCDKCGKVGVPITLHYGLGICDACLMPPAPIDEQIQHACMVLKALMLGIARSCQPDAP